MVKLDTFAGFGELSYDHGPKGPLSGRDTRIPCASSPGDPATWISNLSNYIR